eukprot:4536294-Pyramimonas_sp.AAC.1
MEILAGAASAADSTIGGTGFEAGAVAGGTASFQIQAQDANGNPVVLVPGEFFMPVFTDPATGLPFDPQVQVDVIELGPPGQYEIVYTPPASPTGGDYSMDVQVFLSDSTGALTAITPPQSLTVFAGNAAPSAAQSYLEGGSRAEVPVGGIIQGGQVGSSFSFYLQVIDDNGVQFSTEPPGVQ